jgi:predicted DNA-binding protein
MLDSIVASQKTDLLGQYVSNRVRYFTTRSAKDASTVVKEAIEQLERDWQDRRIAICSGKKAFAALNGLTCH